MSPSRVPRLAALDGFRAYAILGVVAMHLLGLAGALAPGTDFGFVAWGLAGNVIDVFFIISGFLLFLPIVLRGGDLGSLRGFALGRATRLLPGYWLCLAVTLLLLAATSLSQFAPFPDALEIAGTAAAMQMPIRLFDASFPVGFGVNGALWMISVIIGFYLVLPLVARGYFRHPLRGLAVAAAITFGWKLAVLEAPGLFEWLDRSNEAQWVVQLIATDQLPGWAFSFALGMTGAWAYATGLSRGTLERYTGRAVWVAAAAVLVYAACAYIYGDQASEVSGAVGGNAARRDPFLAIVFTAARATLVAAIALGPLWMRRPFENGPARWLARQSYGVYLIHLVIAIYLGVVVLELPRDGSVGAVGQWFGLVIPLSLAYAWLTLRLFELPLKAWVERRRSSPERARSAPEPI